MNFRSKSIISFGYIVSLLFTSVTLTAQSIKWTKTDDHYYRIESGEIILYTLPQNIRSVFISQQNLTREGKFLEVDNISFSADEQKLLLYVNSKKVWRLNTRGDYWVFDTGTRSMKQLGLGRPASSLMFAKLSPDGSKAAYVSEYNLYVEDLSSGQIMPLTKDGNRKLLNGTFDWAYEEEFFCRDGFRWSPDSRQIAFWQIDATRVRDYLMVNNTDSIYPVVMPVEYPVAGETPSPAKIGVVDIGSASIRWMQIPEDTVLRSYIPRMEWAGNNQELILQQLNRKQNHTRVILSNVQTGVAKTIYEEKDSTWIDILPLWDTDYSWGGWDWINGGKEFIWGSEKDGWRHLYRITRDGRTEKLITDGDYDVMDIDRIDEKGGYIYFMASPENATQKYLYRTRIDGKGRAERLSPIDQEGTHEYRLSPNAKFAYHSFSNYYTPNVTEWVSLPNHKGLNGQSNVQDSISEVKKSASNLNFFSVTTEDGVTMDGWMLKPHDFDSSKKYPVVFFVYTEPWGQNVKDMYGVDDNFLYQGSMAKDGYIYISIDNRGTPVPKGRAWRKSVYRKIGITNIRDQALAARKVLEWKFIDKSRIAVWGWSGGGNATLNLMFQYPDIYKTGIAIAAVGNQLTYDNIYQERYMGLPQENMEDFIRGSPITYAKGLEGNLLYVHGTGDDNVHYNNAEMLINELIKHKKQFQFMTYPNRTHSISEGEGTLQHLSTLYTTYLKQFCPPGKR